MADPVTIFNEEVAAGSKGYTLPPNLAFRPTAVTALFDGSGSGSAFLAALSFYSSSGQLLARQFPESSIGAGESVEATFAPFLDRAGGGNSQVGKSTWISGIDGGTIPAGAFTTIQFDGFEYNALGVTTADFLEFQLPDPGGKPLYLVLVWTEIQNSPACPTSNWQLSIPANIPEAATMFVSGTMHTDFKYVFPSIGLLFGGFGTSFLTSQVRHDAGADQDLARCGMSVTYMGEYL